MLLIDMLKIKINVLLLENYYRQNFNQQTLEKHFLVLMSQVSKQSLKSPLFIQKIQSHFLIFQVYVHFFASKTFNCIE